MRLRNVVVMLVLALVCAVAFFVLSEEHVEDGKLPAVWPRFSRGEATKVVLRGQGDVLELRRRAGGADRWDVLVGTELVRADANAIDDLLAAMERQSVRDRIGHATLKEGDAEGYGLAAPTVSAEIDLGGTPLVVRYGKATREGKNAYMDTGPGTDVWIVPKDALDLAVAAVAGGLKDPRLFDSSLFDVARIEVVKGGVTALEAERDLSQVWLVRQPYKGFAHPTRFETELSRIVNAKSVAWTDIGAQVLAKYGLEKPDYEVRITPKGEGREPEVLLVARGGDGRWYAMEKGTKTVVAADDRLVEALAADPGAYRDRSFTRLGFDGVAIDVVLPEAVYTLRKEGATWDITAPERFPAEGEAVSRLLEEVRGWQTVEFLDAAKPEDLGVDGKSAVTIELQSTGATPGRKLVLEFGRGADDASVYARRRDDGGVERVDAGPLSTLRRGFAQFRRRLVTDVPIDDVVRIEREPGFGPDGEKLQGFAIERDLAAQDKTWRLDGPGLTGKLDAEAVNEVLARLRSVQTTEWLVFDVEKDRERMGFRTPEAATMTLSVWVRTTEAGTDPHGNRQKFWIGSRRPEGGHYARFAAHDEKENARGWAFVLPEEWVQAVSRPIAKD